jgi:hypothetical protein
MVNHQTFGPIFRQTLIKRNSSWWFFGHLPCQRCLRDSRIGFDGTFLSKTSHLTRKTHVFFCVSFKFSLNSGEKYNEHQWIAWHFFRVLSAKQVPGGWHQTLPHSRLEGNLDGTESSPWGTCWLCNQRRQCTINSWCYGLEHFLFFHILGIIIPTDFHILQRGRSTTNQQLMLWIREVIHSIDFRRCCLTEQWTITILKRDVRYMIYNGYNML